MIGLLCLGKPDFDAIEPFRNDPFFTRALDLDAVPSSPTLRQRLGQLAGEVDDLLREVSASMISTLAPAATHVYRDIPTLRRPTRVEVFRNQALPLIDEERFAPMYCPDNGRSNRAAQTVLGVQPNGPGGFGVVGVRSAVALRASVGHR